MVVNFTSNIGLAKPTESELALNWTRSADLQEDNNTILETEMNISLTSYTPNLVASTSNPNVGTTGQRLGQYQNLEGFIIGNFVIIFNGSGIAVGSGDYAVTLPFVADPTFHFPAASLSSGHGPNSIIGEGYFFDASAVTTSGSFALELVTTGGVSYVRCLTETYAGKAARVITESMPVAPAAGDSLCGSFAYKRT